MKLVHSHKLLALLVGTGLSLSFAACKKGGKDDDDDDDEETTTVSGSGSGGGQAGDSSTVPQVGAISLSELGTEEGAALALTEDGQPDCKQEGMGAMGIAFGSACRMAPMAANFMLGREDGDFDGDGDMDCNDYTQAKAEGKGVGLMLHLLCDPVMLKNDNVVSLAFGDDTPDSSFAVGFTDFENDTTAAGSWTQGNAASYPADVRIWQGTTMSDLKGHVALGLKDVNNGTIYLDSNGKNDQTFQTVATFSNKTLTGDCLTDPGTETCHNQDIKMYSGEGTTNGAPNGVHLRVFADDKKAPTFIAIEGRFRFTDAMATAQFANAGSSCPGSEMAKVRSIYVQAIQKGAQAWAHMTFRDGSGNLLSCTTGGIDPFQMLGSTDGICQDRGKPTPVACTDIVPADFASMWEGEAEFDNVTASPIGDIWDGAPTQRGICTTTGCGEAK